MGRLRPVPSSRAIRFALPCAGSHTTAEMPSRSSIDRRRLAAAISLPGGFDVLTRMYADSFSAASRARASSARGCCAEVVDATRELARMMRMARRITDSNRLECVLRVYVELHFEE